MPKLVGEEFLAILSKINFDKILKFITACCFIICLILGIIKAYNSVLLDALTLIGISIYSAYINDKILSTDTEQGENE